MQSDMTTFEYLVGLSIAISVGVSMSLILRKDSLVFAKLAVGVFIGFTGFLVGLMAMTVIGGVYLNSFFASAVLSLLSRKAWSNL